MPSQSDYIYHCFSFVIIICKLSYKSNSAVYYYLRTQFTGIQRYSYIDPDFALTDEETQRKQEHTQLYLNYIRDSRTYRELKSNKRYCMLGRKSCSLNRNELCMHTFSSCGYMIVLFHIFLER